MSLFERIKNKRYDLQEKRKFPGDESGAYKQAKDDLEARKGFSKNKPGGLKADEKNPFVKRSVRKTRVDKLGGDIYDQPKFSQKKFDKSLKKFSKGPRTNIVNPFGKGDTPGQQKVKAMDIKAFVKTPYAEYDPIKQPRGIKIPGKTYRQFRTTSRGTRDISSMNPSERQRAFGSSSTEGGAGVSGSTTVGTGTKTKPQKSASGKDYTKKINQANKNRKEFTGNNKSFQAFKKQADAASDKLVSKRQVVRSTTGTKDVNKIRDINKQIKATERISKGYDLASKGKGLPNAPVVASDLKTVTDNTPKITTNVTQPPKSKELKLPVIKEPKPKPKTSPTTLYRKTISKRFGIKPKNILSKPQKSALKTKRLAQKDVIRAAIGPQNRAFFKKAISLPGAKKAAPVIKALAKAGPVGRVAAAVGTVAALSPSARKGMSGFAKRALTGAGLGGIVGGAAASQKETDKERIKKNLKPEFVKDKDGKEIKTVTRMGLNLSDISKPKKKDKGRTAQSIATEVDYLKKRQKVAPYGAKYTG